MARLTNEQLHAELLELKADVREMELYLELIVILILEKKQMVHYGLYGLQS